MKNFNLYNLLLILSLTSAAADNQNVDIRFDRQIKGPIIIYTQTNNVTGEKIKAMYDSVNDRYKAYEVFIDRWDTPIRKDLNEPEKYYKDLEEKYAGFNEPLEPEKEIKEPSEI